MIDVATFQYSASRLQDLYNHLKSKGFNVYMPGIKHGDCITPYIVVKNDGATSIVGTSSKSSLYMVMCYVPKQSYSKLEPYVQSAKKAICELQPMFIATGLESSSFYDDSVKAHTVSIQYRNSKKI